MGTPSQQGTIDSRIQLQKCKVKYSDKLKETIELGVQLLQASKKIFTIRKV